MNIPVFVASGSYGCVVKPGYTCSKKHKKIEENTVSKLFPKKKEWLKEIQLQEIVQTILDPNSSFTIKMIDSCQLKPITLKKTKNIEECSLVNENQSNNIYQIIYEYGGFDLYNIIYRKTNNEKYLNINIIDLFHSFVNIFEGLKILAKFNYIHHDIKIDNILYDIYKNKSILIDFGFLMNIKKSFNSYAFLFKDPHNITFKYFPPEYNIMFFAYINKNTIDKNDIENINLYLYYTSLNSMVNKILNFRNIPNEYKNAFNNIINTVEKYIKEKSIQTLKLFKDACENKLIPNDDEIDKYIKKISILHSINKIDIRLKIDCYMFGLLLLSVICYSFIHLNETNKIYNIPIKLFDLILKMIDINPFTRIDINEATIEYKKIFGIK